MTFCTWDEYKEYITDPQILKLFELDKHPEGTERSSMNEHICFCKECREKIEEETEKAWLNYEID